MQPPSSGPSSVAAILTSLLPLYYLPPASQTSGVRASLITPAGRAASVTGKGGEGKGTNPPSPIPATLLPRHPHRCRQRTCKRVGRVSVYGRRGGKGRECASQSSKEQPKPLHNLKSWRQRQSRDGCSMADPRVEGNFLNKNTQKMKRMFTI